jgi:hypothetical protein
MAAQALGEETIPPVLGGVPRDPQRGGEGGVALAGHRPQDDPGPQGCLLAARARVDAPLQFGPFGGGEFDDAGVASHRIRSREARPPIRQAYTQHSFRSNLSRMDY